MIREYTYWQRSDFYLFVLSISLTCLEDLEVLMMAVKLNLLIEQLVKLGSKPYSARPLTTNANDGKNLVLILKLCEIPGF